MESRMNPSLRSSWLLSEFRILSFLCREIYIVCKNLIEDFRYDSAPVDNELTYLHGVNP